MRFLLSILVACAIALGLGGWSAQWAVEHGTNFDAVRVGPWSASPFSGTPEADPYAKARRAKLAQLTLGGGEGIVFQAETDALGNRLRRECEYRLSGRTPVSRVFTLSAHTDEGQLILPESGRPGWLTSNSILRSETNSFEIAVGPEARAGNWLAPLGQGPYILTLALYDTPASAITGAAGLELPTILPDGC